MEGFRNNLELNHFSELIAKAVNCLVFKDREPANLSVLLYSLWIAHMG